MEFFSRFAKQKKFVVSVDDILPEANASKEIKERAIYRFYIDGIKRRSLDDRMRFYRQKSLVGELNSQDYCEFNTVLELAKKHAQYQGYMMPLMKESGKFYAYNRVKSYALLISQILFVNNCIKEGMLDLIEPESIRKILQDVSQKIIEISKKSSPIGDDEARFYATVFLLQIVFDKIFVPQEDVISYTDTKSGTYKRTESWNQAIAYLELTNNRIITASEEEKRLCYNITTGWSAGIDRVTWDLLNTYYYSAVSPTTGEENLFTKNYDKILERMLPQFALSKVKLAEQIIQDKPRGVHTKILDIGAGSGALAIDLIMACIRACVPVSEIEYFGVEPSEYMRRNFKSNIQHKLGSFQLPGSWALEDGTLESVTASPNQYIKSKENIIIVFSYCLHHCFSQSVVEFFNDREVKKLAHVVYDLDVIQEHGWTKPYYMWADCESPENFDNVAIQGVWNSETLWILPSTPIGKHAITNAWCSLRKLT